MTTGRVVVIGTFHAESGQVTVPALLDILERIRPEVIFLEVPVGGLAEFLDAKDATLESQTAKRFSERHPVELVPVDLPTPSAGFFHQNENFHRRIERTSNDYCRLIDAHSQRRKTDGFAYLNSASAAAYFEASHEEILATIRWMGSQEDMTQAYSLWRSTNTDRETAWVTTITSYRQTHHFMTGVLLVGAAHRPALFERVRAAGSTSESSIDWDFNVFPEGSDLRSDE